MDARACMAWDGMGCKDWHVLRMVDTTLVGYMGCGWVADGSMECDVDGMHGQWDGRYRCMGYRCMARDRGWRSSIAIMATPMHSGGVIM